MTYIILSSYSNFFFSQLSSFVIQKVVLVYFDKSIYNKKKHPSNVSKYNYTEMIIITTTWGITPIQHSHMFQVSHMIWRMLILIAELMPLKRAVSSLLYDSLYLGGAIAVECELALQPDLPMLLSVLPAVFAAFEEAVHVAPFSVALKVPVAPDPNDDDDADEPEQLPRLESV